MSTASSVRTTSRGHSIAIAVPLVVINFIPVICHYLVEAARIAREMMPRGGDVRSVSFMTMVVVGCFIMLDKGTPRIFVVQFRLWQAVMAEGVVTFGVCPQGPVLVQ